MGVFPTGVGVFLPSYLSFDNPLEITERDWFRTLEEMESGELTASEYREQLQSEGYDGLMMEVEDNGIKSFHYITFSSEQIKSATGNSGAFNFADANILRQGGDAINNSAVRGVKSKKKGATSEKDKKLFQFELFDVPGTRGENTEQASDTVPGSGAIFRDDAPGRYATRTRLVEERTKYIGADRIIGPSSAAQALSGLPHRRGGVSILWRLLNSMKTPLRLCGLMRQSRPMASIRLQSAP